jgi:histidyl-tRNA synthetase
MIQLIRGFKDILPGEIEVWQHVESVARSLFEDFNFKEIRLPILEHTELFARAIGQGTDIVEKEMYTFPDRKGDLMTMRPEATAGVVRSYIQHKQYANDPIRKYYFIGPVFRRERPQKGRYRQFYQINAEILGVDSAYADVQLIYMLHTLFSRLSVGDTTLVINSIGCPECRPAYKEALLRELSAISDQLCTDCLKRRDRNPLRVLDCKVPTCKEATKDAPSCLDYLCPDCSEHFEKVKTSLEDLEIPFVVDHRLVRGLDYYTRTVFEMKTTRLGAQDAVAGGGRYDVLVEMLGGPPQPATGFAIGFDRLVELAALEKETVASTPDLFIAPLGERSQMSASKWSCDLGGEGVRTEMDLSGRSLKSMMKRANRLGAAYVLIVGDKELDEGEAVLRNMTTKEQVQIPLAGLVDDIKQRL